MRRHRHVRRSLASIFDIRHLIEAFRALTPYNGIEPGFSHRNTAPDRRYREIFPTVSAGITTHDTETYTPRCYRRIYLIRTENEFHNPSPLTKITTTPRRTIFHLISASRTVIFKHTLCTHTYYTTRPYPDAIGA